MPEPKQYLSRLKAKTGGGSHQDGDHGDGG